MTGVRQHWRIRRGALLASSAALLLSSCIYNGWPFRKKDPWQVDVPRSDVRRGVATEGVGWKVVSGKREPRFLLARDGTECMVTQAKWDDAVVGEQAMCIWTIPKS